MGESGSDGAVGRFVEAVGAGPEEVAELGRRALDLARPAVRMAVGRAWCTTCGANVGPWLHVTVRLSSVDEMGLEAKRSPVVRLDPEPEFEERLELRAAATEHADQHPEGYVVTLRAPGSWRGAVQVEGGEGAWVEG